MKIVFFLLFWCLLNSSGKVKEREKQHKKHIFCTDSNFGQKFKSSIGKIHPFVTLITISVEEGADRVKFALLHSDAQTTGQGNAEQGALI